MNSGNKKNITTLIFDWGGVFCSPAEPFSHPCFLKIIGMTPSEIEQKVKNIQKSYYKGKISYAEFWQKIIKHFNISEKLFEPEELNQAYLSSYEIYPRMFELIEKLKHNFKLALLSNLTQEMMNHILKTHELKNKFDCLIFSNEVHCMKPEKKIYRLALEALNSLPCECVFIDDSEKNTDAAKKMGMKIIHFKSPNQCFDELKK